MKHVLHRDRLEGARETTVSLRPGCYARVVSETSEAQEAVAHLCQTWGGAGNPIVPVSKGEPAPYLASALVVAEVDGFTCREGLEVSIPYLESEAAWDYPAAVVIAHERKEGSRPIEVVDLAPGDPWRLAYLACLGSMANDLDEFLCLRGGVTELDISEIIPIERVETVGSLDDLLARLANYEKLTPRFFSTLYLASGREPNTGYMGPNGVLPSPWERETAAGPNIVVVMERDSVEDLALLWNLRAQWGDSRAMPIGLPREAVDAAALERLKEPGVRSLFGFGGGELYLVSESVSMDELRGFAELAPAVQCAEPRELVRLGQAPGRSASHLQVWSSGETRVPLMTEGDRAVLSATVHRRPSLRLSVRVPDAPIPTVGPLRGRYFTDFHCGMAQMQAASHRGSETKRVHWPSPWACLDAAAVGLGLDVRESQPGRNAMNLIRALGSTWDVRYLADEALIDLLYELAERSGMSWWKERWNGVERRLREEGRSVEEVEVLAREMGRDDSAVAPPNEGRQFAQSRFQKCIGSREAANKWLEWAVDHRLVVKGIELSCPDCNISFWVPVQEMAPPHTCPGCSRDIAHPFRTDLVTFKYRIGEVLRQCLEVDALGHVLALRWLIELFDNHGLVGAHPGVEFLRDGQVVAEADVVLLFQDGSLVPVEVKRRAHAFGAEAAGQLDRASEVLGAAYDVMVVTDPAEKCTELAHLKRHLPDRPRFLLTLDQLTSRHVVWSMGRHPFEAGIDDQLTAEQRRAQWVTDISRIGELAEDWAVSETINRWRQEKGLRRDDAPDPSSVG